MSVHPFTSAPLNKVLQLELASGNQIVADGPPLPHMTRLILLARPFQSPFLDADSDLRHTAINDPHWWLAELADPSTGEVLACKFGATPSL